MILKKTNKDLMAECQETMVNLPFIKLFKTPRCYYFYDVNRDMICSIEENTYNYLEKLFSGEQNLIETEEYKQLKKMGWLSTHRSSILEHPYTDNVDIWLEHQVFQLVLQITQACNLTCIYCPYANSQDNHLSRSHTNKMMNFETAKKAIDFLADHSDASKELFISFYGGEPLISFSIIKECVEYADKIFEGRDIRYAVTTNATLLTDDMIRFFYKKRFYITFSLDGPKDIHDKHRLRIDGSPTYEDVMSVLEKTIEIYGDIDKGLISINMVINPEDNLDNIIKWLENSILKTIEIRSCLIENDYLERKFFSTDEYTEKYNYQYALGLLDYLQIVQGLNISSVIEPEISSITSDYSKLQCDNVLLPDVSAPSGPCVSGVRKLFVNTDGLFYPCEKVNELAKSMIIGDINTGFNVQRIKEHLNIAKLSHEKCRNCWVQNHCSICQRQAEDGNVLSNKKNMFCNWVENDFMSNLYKCALLQEYKTVYTREDGWRD